MRRMLLTLTAGDFPSQWVPWFAGVELQQPENEYMWDGFEPPVVNGARRSGR